MRIDDHDDIDIDLSRHRGSRIPGMLVIGAALGVALIAAWVFAPMLLSRDATATGGLFARAKPRPAAQEQAPAPLLASAPATPVVSAAPPVADTRPPASTDDQAAAPAAPAVAETTAPGIASSSEAATAAGANGEPSWKRTSGRNMNCQRRAVASRCQETARQGDVRGDARTLLGDGLLGDLNKNFLAGLQQVRDDWQIRGLRCAA